MAAAAVVTPSAFDTPNPAPPATRPPQADLIGTTIDNGRIELVSILGLGAYGVVYLARDVKPSNVPLISSKIKSAVEGKIDPTCRYAVKCLNKVGLDARQRSFQTRELRLHSKASKHPNVVTLHAIYETPTYIFMVLDFMPDGDLFTMITASQRYIGRDALISAVFLQIVDAVEYCHKVGIAHRDLKPENILCKNGGDTVVLADFGLSTDERTSSDFGCGSSFYMSPETQGEFVTVRNKSYSTKHNDIWSLGVILVNLTCGRNPWRQATFSDDTFRAYVADRPNFLRTILPISQPCNEILNAIFHLNAENRVTLPQLRSMVKKVRCWTMSPEELRIASKATKEAAKVIFTPAMLGNIEVQVEEEMAEHGGGVTSASDAYTVTTATDASFDDGWSPAPPTSYNPPQPVAPYPNPLDNLKSPNFGAHPHTPRSPAVDGGHHDVATPQASPRRHEFQISTRLPPSPARVPRRTIPSPITAPPADRAVVNSPFSPRAPQSPQIAHPRPTTPAQPSVVSPAQPKRIPRSPRTISQSRSPITRRKQKEWCSPYADSDESSEDDFRAFSRLQDEQMNGKCLVTGMPGHLCRPFVQSNSPSPPRTPLTPVRHPNSPKGVTPSSTTPQITAQAKAGGLHSPNGIAGVIAKRPPKPLQFTPPPRQRRVTFSSGSSTSDSSPSSVHSSSSGSSTNSSTGLPPTPENATFKPRQPTSVTQSTKAPTGDFVIKIVGEDDLSLVDQPPVSDGPIRPIPVSYPSVADSITSNVSLGSVTANYQSYLDWVVGAPQPAADDPELFVGADSDDSSMTDLTSGTPPDTDGKTLLMAQHHRNQHFAQQRAQMQGYVAQARGRVGVVGRTVMQLSKVAAFANAVIVNNPVEGDVIEEMDGVEGDVAMTVKDECQSPGFILSSEAPHIAA